MTYIGIDPGISGALFAITDAGLFFLPMPVVHVQMTTRTKGGKLKEKNVIDAGAVRAWLVQFADTETEICIEHVGPMPDQGAVACFSFGEGFGLVQGIIVGLGFRWSRVRPQAWKKVVMAGEPKWSEANVAARLFPQVSFLATERSRTAHSGIVDAALIAEFLRRERTR